MNYITTMLLQQHTTDTTDMWTDRQTDIRTDLAGDLDAYLIEHLSDNSILFLLISWLTQNVVQRVVNYRHKSIAIPSPLLTQSIPIQSPWLTQYNTLLQPFYVLHMVQLMPLPPNHLCFRKFRMVWFILLAVAYPVCPGKRAVTWVLLQLRIQWHHL